MAAGRRAFERRVVVLGPGGRRPYRDEEWRGAIVSIERRGAIVSIEQGEIELERPGHAPRPFRRGDLLWLAGLGLSAIHNPGPFPAVLAATSRRRAPDRTPKRRPT
jgi:hypothetical protein